MKNRFLRVVLVVTMLCMAFCSASFTMAGRAVANKATEEDGAIEVVGSEVAEPKTVKSEMVEPEVIEQPVRAGVLTETVVIPEIDLEEVVTKVELDEKVDLDWIKAHLNE